MRMFKCMSVCAEIDDVEVVLELSVLQTLMRLLRYNFLIVVDDIGTSG